MNRIFLGITLLASLVWIGYVSLDILSESSNYTPEYLFGKKDDKVLVINRPEEVNINSLPDFANAPLAEIYRDLDVTQFNSAFLSANQAQLLLTRQTNWTADEITRLFAHSTHKPHINSGTFRIGTANGRYYKKNLYIWEGSIVHHSGNTPHFQYDKKASASILHLTGKEQPESVTDIYFKGNERIDYITWNDAITQGKQVNDEEVFAHVVTRNFSRYHFLERDFYAGEDSIFAEGPMFRWMDRGFLELEYEGSTVLISDYIDGQDPVLILNDLNQKQGETHFTDRLTRNFPSGNQSYVVKYLEDLVVISENEAVCDKVIGDFKLGNTIALHKGTRFNVYGSLPRSVSERIVTRESAYSRAVYRGRLLETQMGPQLSVPETAPGKKSITLNCGFDVTDFAVLPKQGNVVAVGAKGEIVRFRDGKVAWTKRLGADLVGGVQLIDLHQTGEQFILVNTRDEIHVFNLNGEAINGFPVKLEKRATLPTRFYRWKSQSYFLQVTEENEVGQYDAKGRELNIFRIPLTPSRPVDIWASRNILFAGFANDNSFAMYDLESRKLYREFALPGPSFGLKQPNELFQMGIQGGQLYKITQKGVRQNLTSLPEASMLGIQTGGFNDVVVIKGQNEIHLLNAQGIPFCKIQIPFNDVQDIYVQTFESGKTITAIIDGLENNVYLYALDGKRLKHEPMEGQTRVFLSSVDNSTVVSTVVDQFIVQYFE